jgi:hypothetical protein
MNLEKGGWNDPSAEIFMKDHGANESIQQDSLHTKLLALLKEKKEILPVMIHQIL